MVYRPLHSLGRFGLAACAVSLGVASLSAQTAPSTTAPVGPNPSRVDIFMGFSYYGAHGQVKPAGINYSSVNEGAIGSGAYYFNKYVGAEVIGEAHPNGNNDSFYAGSGGLIVRAPMQNFTLFAHGLAGAADLLGPNSDAPATFEHEPYRWGPSLTAGGGMDYDLPFFNNKFSLRLFQADYRYIHADYGPSTTIPVIGTPYLGGRANLSGVDLSTGIVAHFGHIIPPPPVTYSCAVSPSSVYPGDPVTVTGTALNLSPKKTATYSWTATNGAMVSGTSSTANIDTKSLAAGTYSVKGHVSEGNKPGMMADCSADFTVKAFEPPTIGCSANPSTVSPGDSSTITANGVSPQNRPLTYSYSATAGSISGNTNTATLSTTGAAPGTITVTCNAVDDKGQTASQMTTVTVIEAAKPPAPTTQSLCSVGFDRDKRRPTRVDNEGKACLDDLALNLQRTTDAKLAVVGNAASSEKMAPKVAAERAVNTKDYLVKEKGIDASRVMVYTGSQDANTVSDILVPSGATLDMTGLTPVDEGMVKAQPRMPLHTERRRHHHKKSK
jgi:outer membrane protein OmpA-like peptidoglycan-associated protein